MNLMRKPRTIIGCGYGLKFNHYSLHYITCVYQSVMPNHKVNPRHIPRLPLRLHVIPLLIAYEHWILKYRNPVSAATSLGILANISGIHCSYPFDTFRRIYIPLNYMYLCIVCSDLVSILSSVVKIYCTTFDYISKLLDGSKDDYVYLFHFSGEDAIRSSRSIKHLFGGQQNGPRTKDQLGNYRSRKRRALRVRLSSKFDN